MSHESFPRRYARSQRFTLGTPRNVRVADDGSRILFLRSRTGYDPVNCLWTADTASGDERLLADPTALDTARGDLPAAERAQRERAREGASGIVGYDADDALATAAYALAGRLFVVDVATARITEIPGVDEAFDPRLSPDASRVAYVTGRALRIVDRDGSEQLVLADESATVSWGSAEFVAAEEMGRARGHWWSPEGDALLVARVDVTPVAEWWVASPATPWRSPTAVRYPAAGTANAIVDLFIVRLDGSRATIDWRADEFEYVARAGWAPDARPLLTVQTRDQRTLAVLDVDPATGAITEVHRETDDAWVELTPGAPLRRFGSVFVLADRGGSRCLLRDGAPLTPPGLEVRSFISVSDDAVIVIASPSAKATDANVYRVGFDGSLALLTNEPGVHDAAAGGDVVVVTHRSLAWAGARTTIEKADGGTVPIVSHAADPELVPRVEIMQLGPQRLATALVLPRDHDGRPLPVLMDPYGGPHAQRVVRSRDAYLVPQWFADQGFAVVIVDGRGTPGRGSEWERSVHWDLAGPVLADQVEALDELLAARNDLDGSCVAIRGWSFGGYLAALAVLERPDRFHAAIAGAPVTDWRLYDTHYTERYLGEPGADDAPYARCDLVARAATLERPLLLIHGLADDNVVAAHTLQLSRALLESGRAHQVLPLSDVSHMTPQDVVAENLLVLQLDFLRTALDLQAS
jgi:dipeptidyl-peptidase-4